MSSLLASVRPESLIPAFRVCSAGSRVLTPLSFGSERQQSLGRHRSGSTPPARGKAPAEVSHWTRVLQKTRLLQPVTRTESFQVHLRPLFPVEERPCVPGARGHATTQHVCPCGGESGICRPLSPRPQAAARLPVGTRFSAALTGPASPRGPDVQLPTCSQGCGGSRGGPSGSLSGRLRARPCSPLKTGVLATGTSARGLIGRRALQRRSSPSDVPGGREPIRRGPDRRGTVGTEPDAHQGAAGLPADSGGRGGEPPGGVSVVMLLMLLGLQSHGPGTLSRSPCLHESSGRGHVPVTHCHVGCPQRGPQCRPGPPGVRAGLWALSAPGTKAKGSVPCAGPAPP